MPRFSNYIVADVFRANLPGTLCSLTQIVLLTRFFTVYLSATLSQISVIIMGDELWKEGYGIKFKEFKDKPDQPDVASPTDAIPARNSIWDSQNAYDLDQVVLHGFTIADLIDLGALAATNEETNVLPNNLAGDVHPAFAIDKWETSVPIHFKRKHMFPLSNNFGGLPRPGNYTANNLLVWKALLPCLRLASKFVENAHIFPWVRFQLVKVTNEVSKLLKTNLMATVCRLSALRHSPSRPYYG